MRPRGYAQASQSGRTNSLAIAALVCAIVGLLFPPACLIAIILGHLARREIRRTGEDGYGLATAGLTLGYLFLTLEMLVPLMALTYMASGGSFP